MTNKFYNEKHMNFDSGKNSDNKTKSFYIVKKINFIEFDVNQCRYVINNINNNL